jgi:hypothetical protein
MMLRQAKANYHLVTNAAPQLDASVRQLPSIAFAMDYAALTCYQATLHF